MDQKRFEELIRKRDGVGLSDEEAGELGRLIAQREGKPYRNADDIHAEEHPSGKVIEAEEVEAMELEEAGDEATPESPQEEQEEDREAALEERGAPRYS
jgi:hypothetical protein